jgi:hypothetical protein
MRLSRRFPSLVLCSFLMCAASLALSGCNNGAASSNPSNPSSPSNPGSSGSQSSSVAYVYVTSETASSGPTQIVAYAADANGQLTAVTGSPFNQNVGSMTASSAYLIAGANSGSNINTYTIGSNGALTLGPQFNYAQIASQIGSQVGGTCGMEVDTFDRAGQSLYTEVPCTAGPNNMELIASFAFDSSNGTLSYLGDTNTGVAFSFPGLSFLGNNNYAYQVYPTGCSTILGGGVFSFARSSNGLLNSIPTATTPQKGPPMPPDATSGSGPFGYVAGPAATDTTNHVAFVEDACFFVNGSPQPVQLAAYTANSDGSLTTTDTYATMPSTTIAPADLAMSPSGTLLAVGGSGGLQIFHFNGASSMTSFTGVLTTDTIGPMLWDNSNHLYALAPFQAEPGDTSGPGKLHVFNVTDSGATEAPGSPYTIQNPLNLAVSSQSGN